MHLVYGKITPKQFQLVYGVFFRNGKKIYEILLGIAAHLPGEGVLPSVAVELAGPAVRRLWVDLPKNPLVTF